MDIKVHIRLSHDGQSWAVTDREVDDGNDLDMVSTPNGPYRDFIVVVSADPPDPKPLVMAMVSVPPEDQMVTAVVSN